MKIWFQTSWQASNPLHNKIAKLKFEAYLAFCQGEQQQQFIVPHKKRITIYKLHKLNLVNEIKGVTDFPK